MELLHKKLEAELISIAHSILQMKNRNDVKELKRKSYEIYERLALISFIEDFVSQTPDNKKTKEEIFSELFSDSDTQNFKKNGEIKNETPILNEDFKEVIPLEKTVHLLENESYVISEKFENTEKNQKDEVEEIHKENDQIHCKKLQIDLNDKIALVKYLFDSNQEDFNKVISHLNTMSSMKEALLFIEVVKKDFNWKDKKIYEERLISLIEKKFD